MFTKWKVYQLLVQDKHTKEMLSVGQGTLFTRLVKKSFSLCFEQLDVDGGRPGNNKVIDLPS